MPEKYLPQFEEAEQEKNEEKVYEFFINDKGELAIDGFGDINNPYNEDARSPDEQTGINKIDRWLETEKNAEGEYIKARFKDRGAYDKHVRELLTRGQAATRKLHKGIVERLTGRRIARAETAVVNLEGFTKQLSDFIDSDPELRGQIYGWDLKQLKSRKNADAQYRLTVYFESDWAKSGKKKKNFVGSYKEVRNAFERELDKLAQPLKVVEV